MSTKSRGLRNRQTAAVARMLFFVCAAMAVVALAVIMAYIFGEGVPFLFRYGLLDFLSGRQWQPRGDIYGIFPMILASIYSTLGAILLGVPVGILAAVCISEFAPRMVRHIVKPMVQLLAAIPSVVYGFFGLVVFVPMIDRVFGGGGNSLLAVIIVLAVMILPTIISMASTSLEAVPGSLREASLALGCSKAETIFKVVMPAAKSGIFAGVVLGIGRAVGETMAVMMVSGNTVRIPAFFKDSGYTWDWLLKSVRTLTANCALEMGYASGDHQRALFATGVVLFFFIMILNLALAWIKRRSGGKV